MHSAYTDTYYTVSLGSRPSPLRRFTCERSLCEGGTLKTGDDTSREDRRKVTQRHVASTTNIVCLHSRSYRRVINARYSVVYSSLASSLFSKHKLSNGTAVPRRRATSCLPLVYPHVMYHPTSSRSFPPPHGRTINARN